MSIPSPPPELTKLNYFVGKWTWDSDIRPTPTSQAGKLTMTERNQWMEGGFFLVLRSEFSIAGVGEGIGTAFMGYDRAKNAYTYDEFNSMGTRQHSTGALHADTWTWVGEERTDTGLRNTRLTMKALSPKLFTFCFEQSSDGREWTIVMVGKASKQEP